ncbi:Uu.00g002220.m01.CDS01 [Anthostomella pinea]|uniref:Uu.00g002220.m01.CDS01 n=1 Tax=Anthostomella pinea TaxID=933095 RepID=A0AAI8YIL6_9PEZI|nr:Uu.00g002220.m01.CDS01 [Anthostomella pinea]
MSAIPLRPAAASISSVLGKIPQEAILILVSSHLDWRDCVVLTLTCKDLRQSVLDYHKLYLSYWRDLQERRILIYWKFLWQSANRLPGFVCTACCRFHTQQSIDAADQLAINAVMVRDGDQAVMGDVVNDPCSDFQHAKDLILHGFKQSPRSLPIEDLNRSSKWEYTELGHATMPSVRVRAYIKSDTNAVVDLGHLILHRTRRMWVPQHAVTDSFSNGSLRFRFKHHFRPCAHVADLSTFYSRPALEYPSETTGVSSGQREGKHWAQFGHTWWIQGKCPECATNYGFTMHSHGKSGVEIVFDTYQDLGRPSDRAAHGGVECRHRYRGTDWVYWYYRVPRRYDVLPLILHRSFRTDMGEPANWHPSAPKEDDLRRFDLCVQR